MNAARDGIMVEVRRFDALEVGLGSERVCCQPHIRMCDMRPSPYYLDRHTTPHVIHSILEYHGLS